MRFPKLICALQIATLVACMGRATTAYAHEGDGEGVGPVLGYSNERSWSFGWEASWTRLGPFVKASLGGVYHVAPNGRDPFAIHYAALDAWFLLGGTLGIAAADGREAIRLAYGVWEGFPLSLTKGGDSGKRIWMLTFTVGLRAFGSTSQIFFAPKIWSYVPFVFN